MYEISENISINENEITELLKVDNKYYVFLSSGERIQINETQFNELKERG